MSLDTADKLGVLERVRNRLVNDPDKAMVHLDAALNELEKSLRAIDNDLAGITRL